MLECMIVYASKPTKNTDARTPFKSWRRALDVGWCYVTYGTQVRCVTNDGSTWRFVRGGWSLSVTRHFAIGREHDYYDGPLCSISFGFVHFMRDADDCPKCDAAGGA